MEKDNSKAAFVAELTELRRRVVELEAAKAHLQAAENALQDREKWFNLLFEAAPLGHQSLDKDGHLIEVNKAWLDLLGYSREEVIGRWFGEFLPPYHRERFQGCFARFKADGRVRGVEFEMVRKDGSRFVAAFDGKGQYDEQGDFERTYCILSDITERKQAEAALYRTNRALRVLSKTSAALVHSATESSLFDAVCRIAVEEGGYRFAWVGVAEQDEDKRVRPIAQNGFETGYLATVNITWADAEHGRGPTGTAIRTGRPYLACNIPDDPNYAPWRTEAIQRGYLSSIALPLIIGGIPWGALNLYAPEPDAFDVEEVRLLEELTINLAHGIKSLRARAARARAEETLRQRSREAEALHSLVHQISASLSLDRVMAAALDEVAAATGPDLTLLFLREGDELLLQSVGPQDFRFSQEDIPVHRVGECLCGLAVRQRQPIYSTNIHRDPRCTWEECKKSGICSFAALPLRSGQEIVGVMGLASATERNFEEQAIFLETLANEVAVGVQNARLYEQSHGHAAELELRLVELHSAREALQRSLEQTARGQHVLLTLSQAAQAVQRARTPVEVYRAVGEGLASIGFQCGILTLSDDRTCLAISHVTHEPALMKRATKLTGLSLAGYRFPLQAGGIFERCIVQRETIYTEGSIDHVAETLPGLLRPLAARLISLLGVKKGVFAPLTIGDETIGVLSVTGSRLLESDVPAITAFANQASIALENARLTAEARTRSTDLEKLSAQLFRAQEEERRRISLELHDEMGQTLTGIGFDLAAIEREWPPDVAPETRERLVHVGSLLAEVDDRVSDMALDLRPQMLDDLGLLPTLHWYVDRYIQRMGIDVELEALDFEERLTPNVTTTVYRVVQEALTNVAKHAQASRVAIRLERRKSTVAAVVQDNGRGFEAEKSFGTNFPERGAGLLGIRERVALLGGTCEIQSHPGQGTRLMIEVPI